MPEVEKAANRWVTLYKKAYGELVFGNTLNEKLVVERSPTISPAPRSLNNEGE